MVIDIDDEVIDQIVCRGLKELYEKLDKNSYINCLFHINDYENKEEVERLRSAIDLVYKFYSAE
jgi:hypothetical protein